MADGQGNGNATATIQMVLTYDQLTGQLQISGPIQNTLFALGLLEMAKDAVRNYAAEASKNTRIVPAVAMPRPM